MKYRKEQFETDDQCLQSLKALVKDDKKEYFMCLIFSFYGEYENEKKTGKKNLTFPDGDLNPGFLNKFPPTI